MISLFQALDTFSATLVAPVYYVMFTTLTIIASVIMFKVDCLIHMLGFPSDAFIPYLFCMQVQRHRILNCTLSSIFCRIGLVRMRAA